MTSGKGSELIVKFIEVIEKKIQERKYRWEFINGFNDDCKRVFSSLAIDNYPQVDIFRPLNLPPNPDPPLPYLLLADIEEEKKYDQSVPGGV